MLHLRSLFPQSLRFVLLLCAIVLPMSANASWWYDDDDDDDDAADDLKTITEIVLESGGEFDRNRYDYDILLNAVVAAGLAGVLDDPDADLTVLAPDDKAFVTLAQDLGYHGRDEAGAFDFIVAALTELGEGDPIPVLTNILLYHVSPEEKNLRDLRRDPEIETALEGASIFLFFRELVDKEPELANPKFRLRSSNIQASNGIIHTLSRVLIPVDVPNTPEGLPTIAGIVAASGGDFDRNRRDYDILLNAVIAADLVEALNDEDADLTVFAPDDLAFIRLARTFGYRGFNEERAFNFIVDKLTELGNGDPIPLLTSVLLYHVSPDSQTLNHVIFSDEIVTLLMDAGFSPDGLSLIDEDPGTRNPRMIVRTSDIRASNGIIHTLNRVLLPISVSGH